VHENRIYSLQINCSSSYPDACPRVKFLSRISMGCVKSGGEVAPISNQVDASKVGVMRDWKRHYTMEMLLSELRKEMMSSFNRKLVQPPEGSLFD
jgi:ubiquitin-conjugating enzyme E2 variant